MVRSLMQVYVKNSKEAVPFYEKAFGVKCENAYQNEDGSYIHAELNLFGQFLAVSETSDHDSAAGNTMQFCLHFHESEKEIMENIYKVLSDGAKINFPLGPCFFSPSMFGLIDKYGVNWCMFY